MREEDQLDRMLDASLSSYGDPGPDSGLAGRILARVASEQSFNRSSRWRRRFLLWAALPAAACLLLTLLLLRSAGRPGAIHPSATLPQPASTNTISKAPGITGGKPAQKATVMVVHHAQIRPSATVAKSAARPKLDVFPLPQPLSPEEQALYAFATQVPEKQRQAILAAQQNDDAPLNIAAIHIQPLEVSDTGKN